MVLSSLVPALPAEPISLAALRDLVMQEPRATYKLATEAAGERTSEAGSAVVEAAAEVAADSATAAAPERPQAFVPATRELSFAAYVAGVDAQQLRAASLPLGVKEKPLSAWSKPGCVLELSYELWQILEREFPLGLVQQCLLELAPLVVLTHCPALPGLDEPAREDYPTLHEADFERLVARCEGRYYPGGVSPAQAAWLGKLAHELNL